MEGVARRPVCNHTTAAETISYPLTTLKSAVNNESAPLAYAEV
jgi:hypothetical protein